jgi:hypothetical protein
MTTVLAYDSRRVDSTAASRLAGTATGMAMSLAVV